MHGLYLLWWIQERQVSPVVVSAVLAAGDLSKIFIELPTGWFADRVGHRTSLIVGSIVQAIGMLCCWLVTGVPGLVGASLLVAIGDGFRSGADHALLYRTSVALDREGDFQRIEGRARTAELVGLVALVLIGGGIVHFLGYGAGWMAEIALSLAGAAIAVAMTEPPAAADEHVDVGRPDRLRQGYAGPPKPSAKAEGRPYVRSAILAVIVPGALVAGLGSAMAFFAQTAPTANPEAMTLFVAAITLVEAAGTSVASRMCASGARMQLGLASVSMMLTAAAALPLAPFRAIVITLSFVQGLSQPLRAAAIQRLSADDTRARVASLASACDMTALSIMLPIAGLWRART
jgi:MFS family permease